MKDRVLAFRHVPFEGLGRIEAALNAFSYDIDYADLYAQDAPLVDPAVYSALIFMGGPMSVNDDLPYLRREEGFIRDAIERGVPVLGVCLGAQLIAHALGAQVRRNPVKEIGWFEIQFSAAAQEDRLFAGFGRSETVFHWHGETFDLPAGAVLLASSERSKNQAFRLGSTVYGLQFHPEVTPEMISDWCRQDENCGDVRELDRPIDAAAHADRLVEISSILFRRWCEIVRGRTIACHK
jgi:GMP synthase-like glutamine amidotransferase